MSGYTALGSARLKSGEEMEIGAVDAPAPEWRERLTQFLAHKGGDWLAQIAAAVDRPLGNLQTRFYLGQLSGRPACNIMVAGHRRIGILGHVYTMPEHRRKGAIQALLEAAMRDARQSYDWLSLGTEFESPAYHLYAAQGFRSIAPGRGEMVWSAPETGDPFDVNDAKAREWDWSDWAAWNLLAIQPAAHAESLPRSVLMGLKAQGSIEGAFLRLQARRQREQDISAVTLSGSSSGAALGWAIAAPSVDWFSGHWLLDLHAHPRHQERCAELLGALPLPDAPLCAYVTRDDDAKARALSAAGLKFISTLPDWLDIDSRKRDVYVMARS